MRPATRPPTRIHRKLLAGVAIALLTLIDGATANAEESRRIDPTETGGVAETGAMPLRGQVLDADGRPAAGATMAYRESIDPGKQGWFVPEPFVTRTDEDGNFSSGETVATAFDLRIRAEGHALQTLREIDAKEPLTVHLERGHLVTGRVLARTTGEGIEGIRVALDEEEQFSFGSITLQSTTDKEGHYRIAHAPSGEVWVRAMGTGWARRSVRGEIRPVAGGDPPGRMDDLWLLEGGSLAGRIVDERGRPVAGVKLFLTALEIHGGGRDLTFPPLWGRGNETGHYKFEGVTAGAEYQVRAMHDSYPPSVSEPVFVDVGTELSDIDLVLREGATLRFKLIDAEDQPCTNVKIRLDAEEDTSLSVPFVQTSKTTEDGGIQADEHGWLTARQLFPGRYSILLEPEGLSDMRRVGVVLTGGETIDLGTIRLESGSRLQGRVVDGDDAPVAQAKVTAHWLDMSGRYERQTTSDYEGRFSVGGLPDHSLKLDAVADGFAERKLDAVRAGSDDVVVTLERRGGIRGTVKLAEGGVPASFSVRLYTDDSAVTPSPDLEISAGFYEFRALNPGVYEVQVRVPGRTTGRLEEIQVQPGKPADAGEIVLQPGLRVDGRVVDADGGHPVAGVAVRVDRGAGPPRWSPDTGQLETISNVDGRFSFDELEAGRFTLSLFHPEFAPAQRNLDLDAAVHKSEIEIRLTSGGEIQGIVIDSDGLPVPGMALTAFRGSRAFDLRQTSTTEDGTFRIPRLAPGTYIVMLTATRTGPTRARQVKTVDLREGQLRQIELRYAED